MSEPVRAAVETGGKLLSSLPAQFLALICINAVFIGALFWFLQSEDATHAKMIAPILEMCSRSVPIEVLQHVLQTPMSR